MTATITAEMIAKAREVEAASRNAAYFYLTGRKICDAAPGLPPCAFCTKQVAL